MTTNKGLRIFFYFVLVIHSELVQSQELSNEQLFELSLDSIERISRTLPYHRGNYGSRVSEVYINKAKLEKDTTALYWAYESAVWAFEGSKGISYVDSMIVLSIRLNDYNKIGCAYYAKGGKYYIEDQPILALKHLIKSYDYLLRAKDYELMASAISIISAIKSLYGEKEEAILLKKESIEIYNEHPEAFEKNPMFMLYQYDGIARIYTRLKQVDSSRYYNKKATKLSKELNSDDDYIRALVLDAKINYYDQNIIKSRDTILKYLDNNFSKHSLADDLIYLGLIEGKLENRNLEISYFTKLDSLLSTMNYPLLDHIEEVYPTLLEHAIEKDDKILEKKYLSRIKYYDSLKTVTEDYVRDNTLYKFELPLQESKKKAVERELVKKSKVQLILIISTILAILGAVITAFHYWRIKRRFSIIMNLEMVPVIANVEFRQNEKTINVPQDIVSVILNNLDTWEKNLGFLDNHIDQNNLAKMLGTNSTYLSRIINTFKNQSFSSYLRDLRITYAINRFKEDSSIVGNKSMIQLAEQFGFNSTKSFTSAFKSKVGISPAAFFRQLKKEDI